jgi:hypothetical protein
MAIKHTFVNPQADGPDPTITRPSDWNADHDPGPANDGDVFRKDGGVVEFGLLSQSSITGLVGDLAGKQPLDGTLTALAGLDGTNGLVEETAADTFTKRPIGVGGPTSIPTLGDADARYPAITHNHTTGSPVPEAGLDFVNAPADRNLVTWSQVDGKLKWATSTEYAATSLNVVVGTILLGNVDSLDIKNDANYLEVQEVGGVPGHDTRVTFNNVATFNKIRLRVFATEGSTHLEELRIYNVATTVFDLFTTWGTQLGFTDIPIAVDNGADYIDAANSNRVIVQIYHPLSGVGSHRMRCDFMVVVDDLTGGGGITHHQGLDGLQDPNAHPATAVSNAPAGTIAATTVQAAIDELDTEKLAKAIGTTKGDLIAYEASNDPRRIPIGANGTVPTANSAAVGGFDWQTPAGGGGGSGAFPPTKIDAASTFTVPVNTQVLIATGLVINGGLIINGALVEVK